MHQIENFNVQCFIDAAEELLRSDETIRALNLLDNLPAWYRDNPPDTVTRLKREVMAKIATSSFYATSTGYELTAPPDTHKQTHLTLRGKLLLNDVRNLNKQGIWPHIVDMGPGEFWTPMMLDYQQTSFSYEPAYVNSPSYEHYKEKFSKYKLQFDGKHPTIMFAGEIIEHLWEPKEIRFEMERRIGLADIIHISTPLYTFNYKCKHWNDIGDLGHLRAFTPNEFNSLIISMFPEYEVQTMVSQIMHSRCVLKKSTYNIEKQVNLT